MAHGTKNGSHQCSSFPAEAYPDAAVPQDIVHSYLEARRVFQAAGAYTSTAIMCRRTLEGICVSKNAAGRNLAQKLDDLRERNVIDTRIHGWANQVLRSLGNDAAHDVRTSVSREDARDALEFTKAIIEYLYVFEVAFERFVARREAKAKLRDASPHVATTHSDPSRVTNSNATDTESVTANRPVR